MAILKQGSVLISTAITLMGSNRNSLNYKTVTSTNSTEWFDYELLFILKQNNKLRNFIYKNQYNLIGNTNRI